MHRGVPLQVRTEHVQAKQQHDEKEPSLGTNLPSITSTCTHCAPASTTEVTCMRSQALCRLVKASVTVEHIARTVIDGAESEQVH